MPKTHPNRGRSRPASPPPADPKKGYLPCVVGAYNVTPGVLVKALLPYRDLEEVRAEIDGLSLRRAA